MRRAVIAVGLLAMLGACGEEDAITRRLREHPEIKRDAQIKGAIESRTTKAVTLTHIVTAGPEPTRAVCGTAEAPGVVYIFIKPHGGDPNGELSIFETWTPAVPPQLEEAGCGALIQFAPADIRNAAALVTPAIPAERLSPEPAR